MILTLFLALSTSLAAAAPIVVDTSVTPYNSGMLDLSNVDLTEELINLMDSQHYSMAGHAPEEDKLKRELEPWYGQHDKDEAAALIADLFAKIPTPQSFDPHEMLEWQAQVSNFAAEAGLGGKVAGMIVSGIDKLTGLQRRQPSLAADNLEKPRCNTAAGKGTLNTWA